MGDGATRRAERGVRSPSFATPYSTTPLIPIVFTAPHAASAARQSRMGGKAELFR